MQNNIDYREIVQTVTANVLKDINSQLASMQPGIVNDIAKRAQSALQTSLDSLATQLSDLQRRVSQLEQKSGSASPPPTPVQAPQSSGSTNTSTVSPQLGVDPQASTMLILIQDWPHIVHNSWIFYWNKEENRMYMIRENGSDKTDITVLFNDMSYLYKRYPPEFISVVENGSDWIIKYKDYMHFMCTVVVHMS